MSNLTNSAIDYTGTWHWNDGRVIPANVNIEDLINGDIVAYDVVTLRGNHHMYYYDHRTDTVVATDPESVEYNNSYVITAYDGVFHHRALAVFEGYRFSNGAWATHFSMYNDNLDEPDSVDYDGTWRGERVDYSYDDDHDGYDSNAVDEIIIDYFNTFVCDCYIDLSIEPYDPSEWTWALDGMGMRRCCA